MLLDVINRFIDPANLFLAEKFLLIITVFQLINA